MRNDKQGEVFNMNNSEIVQKLREKNNSSEVAHAVFVKLGLRARARSSITLSSLYNVMISDGFNYNPSEYAEVLEFLASIGLGTLDRDKKGHVRGLVNIPVTIPTIGRVACNSASKLEKFHSRLRPVAKSRSVSTPITVERPALGRQEPIMDLNLELIINGQTAKISVPVISLLDKLRSA